MPARDYYLPQRRLVSQEDAALSERSRIPRSRFIGSWTNKLSFDAGYLVPFLLDELVPGDHMRYDVTAYVRMSTPLFPLFDSQRIDTFFFAVPWRLLWTHFVNFMGETDNPLDTIDYTIPIIPVEVGGFPRASLFDYLGYPTADQLFTGTMDLNALPLRAYNLIWNQWFRDQNLQDSVVKNMDDGPDAEADYTLLKRAKSHDYFTSALPWPQKFTAPLVPLEGTANVLGIGNIGQASAAGPQAVFESDGTTSNYAFYKQLWDAAATNQVVLQQTSSGYPEIFADMSGADVGFTINAFRQAYMVQSFLERDARGGTRYVEWVKAHFDVVNPDFRLQRPEYIGGGQTPLNITPIAQTAPGDDSVVGALGGAGTAAGSHVASYAATEHCYVLGLINVRTELSYQQGVHKMLTRSTRYDLYDPAFAFLGEQAVLKKEIYAIGSAINDDLIFGYQERWQEYRTRYSEVHGLMKSSTVSPTLDPWHLSQYFGSAPVLGPTFIQDTPPMARVLAAGGQAEFQQYLADIHIRRTATRPVPMFGTPAQLGRF